VQSSKRIEVLQVRHFLGCTLAFLAIYGYVSAAEMFLSHTPTRPLPQPSSRPLAEGRHYFVDAAQGNDKNTGSEQQPWQTIARGVESLQLGDTLVLRGGTYYDHATLNHHGTVDKPITIRSYPGELAIIDGGLRVFYDSPATAWEPCPDGAAGEYRSTKTYPGLSDDPIRTTLLGNFGDSWVPLHGYRFRTDMQSDNPYWNIPGKTDGDGHVYCGPGLWYDTQSHRIHVRLAHTKLPGLGEMNYRGETDPRKLPLVVAHDSVRSPITLKGARNVKLLDLVIRGSRGPTLSIQDSTNVTLDGLTIYGGSSCVQVRDSHRLLVTHTACRGLAAPWTFRGSLKYRAIESRLFSASGWDPTGADSTRFEIAYSEFTDSVDGVFLGQVQGVRFHHNLVENVSDDAMFLTAATGYDGIAHGGDVQIYQNRFARNLTCFAFGVGHGRQKVTPAGKQLGAGAWIYRNVFDFRQPVMYRWPSGPHDVQELDAHGRIGGDHGSPTWEPMWIYHNTLLTGDKPRYAYGSDGVAGGLGKNGVRHVFNNIFCQKLDAPGDTLPESPTADFQADGNLFWSDQLKDGPKDKFLKKFQLSKAFDESKKKYAPGWTTHDQYADPRFVRYDADWRQSVDLRLTDKSPAVDAGIALDPRWPDVAVHTDAGAPDLGAIPHGGSSWPIGVKERLSVFGELAKSVDTLSKVTPHYAPVADSEKVAHRAAVLIVQGYPAFDAPLAAFAFRKAGAAVTMVEKTWVDPKQFAPYAAVVYDGSFTRGKIEPSRFSDADLPVVQQYLEQGGTLILLRELNDLFANPAGQQFLSSLVGSNTIRKPGEVKLLESNHRWLGHLKGATPDWLPMKNASVLRVAQGTSMIGSRDGASILYETSVGKGRLIYVGWSPSAAIPHGRKPGTPDDERVYEEQMQVFMNLAADVAKAR